MPAWMGYPITVLAEAALTWALLLLHPIFPLGQYPITYVLLIMLIAYVFGEGPALVAFIIGVFLFDYYFVPPLHTLLPHAEDPMAQAALAAFLLGTGVVAFATLMIRRSRLRAEMAEKDQRRQAQEAADRAAELQAVLDAAPVAVWIGHDPESRTITGNVYADHSIMGVPRGANISRSAPSGEAAVFYQVFQNGKELTPDELPAQIAARTGEPVYDQEMELHFPDGRVVCLVLSAVPLLDAEGRVRGSVLTGMDITALRKAERALEAEEQSKIEFYRRTILAATDGKLVITEDAEIERLAGPRIETWGISEPREIVTIRHAVEDIARRAGMDEERIGHFVVCVGEAATNIVKHAGHGTVSLHREDDALIAVFTDEGPGIPALALPDVALRRGYSTAGTLGMGYKVMLSLSDRIYLATGPQGTTTAVQLALHAPEHPTVPQLLSQA